MQGGGGVWWAEAIGSVTQRGVVQRCLFACERTEAASSFVSFAYRSPVKTRAAVVSILAPVCFSPLSWDRAEAARLFATCDELLLCRVFEANRPIREDVCLVFLDITAPFASGFGGGGEWHNLVAEGWLVINLPLGCFEPCKLQDIGLAPEIAFGQSGECFKVASGQSDVSWDGF